MTECQKFGPSADGNEGGGPFTCCRCLDSTWNDDDWCDACVAEAKADDPETTTAPEAGAVGIGAADAPPPIPNPQAREET